MRTSLRRPAPAVETPDPTAVPTTPPTTSAPTSRDHVVELTDVSKVFGDRAVLQGINLTIANGEFIALLGASGSGKTTLLRILSSLELATSGTLRVAQNRSVVFQEPRLLPFRKVASNVTLGLSRAQRRSVDPIASLTEVGLADHANAWPKSLSGGEAQRVALARALVRAPDLLLLDEPFAALDALTRIKMQSLVLNLWQRHSPGVLFVTHDVDEAVALADRVLVLRDGRVSVDLDVSAARPRDRTSVEFSRCVPDYLPNSASPRRPLLPPPPPHRTTSRRSMRTLTRRINENHPSQTRRGARLGGRGRTGADRLRVVQQWIDEDGSLR